MRSITSRLLQCLAGTLIGALLIFAPLFVLLWLITTFKFATSHTIELAVLIGIGVALASIIKSPTKLTTQDIWVMGCFTSLALLLTMGFAWHGNNQRAKAEAQTLDLQTKQQTERIATTRQTDPASQRNSYCMGIGVKYGRAAASSLRGHSVDPKDDIEIPSECRDLPSTESGIRQGMTQ